MVGFNRRFSPHAGYIKRQFENISAPRVMNYIVNAGSIATDHWIQNPEIGGGRVIGEVCHFIDFVQFIAGSLPVGVYASAINSMNAMYGNNDSLHMVIDFENGSIANITYHALGDTSLPKEYFEVSSGGTTCKMFDFRRTEKTVQGRTSVFKTRTQEKGFREEFGRFFDAVKTGGPSPIPFQEIYMTTLVTFRILESLQSGLKLELISGRDGM